MSVVKSITATLVGAAIHDGHIKSIDDPVTKYLPQLAGSAYDPTLTLASDITAGRRTGLGFRGGGRNGRVSRPAVASGEAQDRGGGLDLQ